MDFLYFLEGLRTPFLNAVMSAITLFGEETLFMAVALLIFWCVDKYNGYLVLVVGFTGTLINQFLKLACRVPRPWVLDSNFTIVESARAGATGYSFPSGHTQNAVGTFGSIGLTSKRRWVLVLSVIAVILVPLSRMYLGVHTPADVSVSFVVASVLIAIFIPVIKSVRRDPKLMYIVFGVMLVLSVMYLLFVSLWRFPTDIDAANLASGRKNAYSLLGSILGICVAYPLDRKYINFETAAVWWAQLLKLALGLGITVGIKSVLKILFTMIFGSEALYPHIIRYALVVIFAGAVWPLTFGFFSRLGRKKAA